MTIGDSVGQKNALYINKVGEGNRWKNRLRRLQTVCLMSFFLLSSSFFASCSESNDDEAYEFADWQSKNDAYFSKIYSQAESDKSGKWKILTKWSLNDDLALDEDHVVVEVLNSGTGSGCPLFTDSVRVHYRGQLIPTSQHPGGFQFESSYSGELDVATSVPAKFAVSSLTDGFSTAVQNMHIGDYWRVYVPYRLAYGSTAQTSIPAYSLLIFHICLDSYYHPGLPVPAWKAKETGWIEE